ncbi:hypothetical protein B0H13DRAFT_1890789 [Mycena leptocephala]|nr:hypothetical protein B0H13DRAFT_1890789 [Mycena leptocephala]
MHSFIQSQRGIPGATKADKRRSVKQRISIRLRSPEEPWERILVGAARRTGWPQERLPKINAIISNIVAGGPEWNASLKSCSLDSKHLASYVRDLQVDLISSARNPGCSRQLLRLFSNVSAPHCLWVTGLRIIPQNQSPSHHRLSLFALPAINFVSWPCQWQPSLLGSSTCPVVPYSRGAAAHTGAPGHHFMPSPVGYQERSPLRHLVLALQPGMIPPVRDLLLDPALAHRVVYSPAPEGCPFFPADQLFAPWSGERCAAVFGTLQHLDIDLNDESAINLPALPDLRFLTLRALFARPTCLTLSYIQWGATLQGVCGDATTLGQGSPSALLFRTQLSPPYQLPSSPTHVPIYLYGTYTVK